MIKTRHKSVEMRPAYFGVNSDAEFFPAVLFKLHLLVAQLLICKFYQEFISTVQVIIIYTRLKLPITLLRSMT